MKLISRWPLILVISLVLLPLVLMAAVGGWALWTSGHWFWLSWALPVCWMLAWLILRFAPRLDVPLPQVGSQVHWTPLDRGAIALIEAEQKRTGEFSSEQLADPKFYLDQSLEIATKVARHYHPTASDPLGPVSIIELLTAAQLAAEDLERQLIDHVPGCHLITVAQWRMLSQAPAWWRTASDIGWLASVLINPASIARYGLSKAFVDPLSRHLQTQILGYAYATYVGQLGFYLVELNSGRLRGGAAGYREWKRKLEKDGTVAPSDVGDAQVVVPVTVKVAVIGQVKAGKSSLVNCLLGERQSAVDVLPLTRTVQRYQLQLDSHSDRLILLDTPGYNDSGATAEQMFETQEAVRDADLVLIVLDARSPSKKSDVEALDALADYFRRQNRLKPPPIVGVVSKIDGLSPVMEWSPPYEWQNPSRPKERTIRAALDYVRETFADRLDSIVPVCSDHDHGRVYGIEEYLLPTVMLLLEEARAVSLVRSLHQEYDRNRASQVVSQLISAGMKVREFAPDFIKFQVEQGLKSFVKAMTAKQQP